MATPYSRVFDLALSLMPDQDLYSYAVEDREAMLTSWMTLAIMEFKRICKAATEGIDLANRDDVDQEFTDDLSDEVVEILAYGIIYARAQSKRNHSDQLQNHLNSKDLALAGSPANLLKELRAYADDCYRDFNRLVKTYSYAFSNLENLKP